ncbi:Cytochrome P450 [Phytophthora megakarya]|uniref:Cytochrome P450 n=1 Tax=Phytophthora megakarya TaxID=4795 RepID=A0A225VKQ8_9STRA|nr:Cytochrome P450 [Phytophthora megakarya]
MMPSSVLNLRGLVSISPGPLLGSTLALVVFWAMRHGRARRLSWTSTPLPPRGYRQLPTASTTHVPVRVGMTAQQPVEHSSAFYDWVFAMTMRFHGKPWVLHRPGRPDVLVLSSPVAFEDVQRTFAGQFDKVDNEAEGLPRDVHGGVIALVCNRPTPLRPSVNMQRQLAVNVLGSPALRQQASALTQQHLSSLLKILEDTADTARLKGDSTLDLTKLMKSFATEIFTELGFGVKLGEASEFESAIDDIQKRVAGRSKRSALMWKFERILDVGNEATLSHSVNVVKATTLEAVKAKRNRRRGDSGCDSPIIGSRVDMLDLLLTQKSSSKSSKDPEFLAEFVLSLVVAARDSMTHTLSKCLECLVEHPEEQEKLVRELKKAKNEGKDLQSIARLEAVIKETLRLHPAKSFIRRRASQDTILSDGTYVAAGTEVAMDLYSMARRENVWGPSSAQFRPQRWIDTATGRLRPTSNYKFNSFLGGPRACVGADIAMTEIKTVIAAVLDTVQLEAVEHNNSEIKATTDGKMLPRDLHHSVRVQVRRRGPRPPGLYS